MDNQRIDSGTPHQQTHRLLENSPFKRAHARLALQDESNLQVFQELNSRPLHGWFPPFDNPSSLELLSRLKSVFTSRSTSSSRVYNSGSFRAWLPMSGGNLVHLASSLAEKTRGTLLLTVTYSLNGKDPIFSPERTPYGRGYKLEFADPYKADYLVGVYEENLLTTRREGDWTCPEDLKFMVHRATSRETSPFNRQLDYYRASLPEGILQEGYCHTGNTKLTRSEEDFFNKEFGVSNLNQLPFEVGKTMVARANGGVEEIYPTGLPCIKFKTPGCYDSGFYRIEFDPEKFDSCKRNHQIGYRDPSNEETYKICPAFMSVCYRRN